MIYSNICPRFSVLNQIIRIVIAVLIIFIAFPASLYAEDIAARYFSSISKEQNRLFFKRIKNKNVTRLLISSDGGEVDAAIKLALWVFENQIDIEVRDYCLSSCANYVFTAAKNKTIHPGAVVAWHGNYHHLKNTGLWRDDIEPRMKRTGESRYEAQRHVYLQMKYLVTLEEKFEATKKS